MSVPQDGLGLHLWTLDNEHLMSYFQVLFLVWSLEMLAYSPHSTSTQQTQHIARARPSSNSQFCSNTFVSLLKLLPRHRRSNTGLPVALSGS